MFNPFADIKHYLALFNSRVDAGPGRFQQLQTTTTTSRIKVTTIGEFIIEIWTNPFIYIITIVIKSCISIGPKVWKDKPMYMRHIDLLVRSTCPPPSSLRSTRPPPSKTQDIPRKHFFKIFLYSLQNSLQNSLSESLEAMFPLLYM